MSETPKSPLTMVGAQDAAACVDGVCEWSPTDQASSSELTAVATPGIGFGAEPSTQS